MTDLNAALWSRAVGRIQRTAVQWQPDLVKARAEAWLQNLTGRRNYRNLSETALRATRRSDTLFVFGSGSSINDITAAEWRHIEAHDTLSFNWFVHQHHVRADYHLVREVAPSDVDDRVWKPALQEYGNLISTNPRYAETVFLVQAGWRAVNCNRVVGLGVLPRAVRVFRFTNRARDRYEPPSASFARGLVHCGNTLGDCVNFGYIMGWRRIVVAGIDMYDHRYFWMPPDQMRPALAIGRPELGLLDPFPAARRLIDIFARWRAFLDERGVTLLVYNPRSLLAEAMSVYQSPVAGAAATEPPE